MNTHPTRFIGASIEAVFHTPPTFSKKPSCPDAFIWEGKQYDIEELISERHDYTRKGRMGNNMRTEHRDRAAVHGSWGVGRMYFIVRVAGGKIYEIYYDRAPQDAFDRGGKWFLVGEREPD